MKNPALLFLALALALPALADSAKARTSVELGVESSHLSNGSPDWREQSLRLSHQPDKREVRELTLTQTERFGLRDQQIGGVYATALSDQLNASLGARISPSHRVLARQTLEGAIQYEFVPAWLLHAGLSDSRYNSASSTQASLMLEHYFTAFSVSAAWRPVRAMGASSSSSELRGSYYYGDADFVGFIVSSGQEATSVNASTVVLADVRASAILGRHWLSRQWALNYAISSTRQGSFYTRSSVRLGAQYLF